MPPMITAKATIAPDSASTSRRRRLRCFIITLPTRPGGGPSPITSSGATASSAASSGATWASRPGNPASSETAAWQAGQLARCSSNSRRSAGDNAPRTYAASHALYRSGTAVHGLVTPFSCKINFSVRSP